MRFLKTSHAGLPMRLVAGAALALAGVCATAAATKPASDVQARYEHERARCMSGRSGQAPDTCLKEAVNAREAATKGQLADGGGKLRENAKDRCDVLAGAEKRDCMSRVKDKSNTIESGSVKGGGILRETVTIEPAAPAASAH